MTLHTREELEIVTADGITTGTALFEVEYETTHEGLDVQSLSFEGLRLGGLSLSLGQVQEMLGKDHRTVIDGWEECEVEMIRERIAEES